MSFFLNCWSRKKVLFACLIFFSSVFVVFLFLFGFEIYLRFQESNTIFGTLTPRSVYGWDRNPTISEPLESLASHPNSIKILCLGDSFVQNSLWPQMVASGLGELGIPVKCWEAGVAGFGQIQELQKLKDIQPGIKPALVVLLFFAWNDLRDNYPFPQIEYNPDVALRPFLNSELSDIELPGSFRKEWFNLRLRKRLIQYVWYANKSLIRLLGINQISAWGLNLGTNYENPFSWRPFYQEKEQDQDYVKSCWKHTAVAFKKIDEFCNSTGSSLFIIGIDNAFTVDEDVRKEHCPQEEGYDPSLPLKKFGEVIKTENLTGISALEKLKKLSKNLKKKIYNGPSGNLCGHFEKEGEQLIAQFVIEYVSKNRERLLTKIAK